MRDADAAVDVLPMQRGVILHALHAQYPLVLLERALRQQVGELVADERVFTRILAYLDDKKLIELVDREIGGVRVRAYRLTADGVDVVERRRAEAGITVTVG